MNAATTKATKATTTKPAAKVSLAKAKASAPELPAISSVKLVPIDLIDIGAQVRTIFDDASLQELAGDIQTRGLLQPVLLNPHGARFTLIAGERRVKACRIAGLSDIPALITKASSSDALLMQLAENIQREDLELQDQVNAIRLLHDNLGTVAAVAEEVKKSAPWVSKRLALSHPDFCYQARSLMEEGVTEDVEILNTLSHLGAINWHAANTLAQQLRAGTATRETARQALKEAKKPKPTVPTATPQQVQEQAAQRAAQEAERAAAVKERTEGTGDEFLDWAVDELSMHCAEPEPGQPGATEYLNELRQDQRDALQVHLQQHQHQATSWSLQEWATRFHPYDSDNRYIEQMVAILALKGQVIDNLYAFVAILEDANTPGDEE